MQAILEAEAGRLAHIIRAVGGAGPWGRLFRGQLAAREVFGGC